MGAGTSAKDLFNEALERPEGERRAFLERACAGDPALRERVERLLAAHERHAAFLLSPTGVVGDPAPLSEGPGTQIGRYRLLQLIGEGGFGSVFMAEQREPVARRVALKIIKLGMDTRQVIARFEAERQALAMMDHPGIARVLDAGATESGRPYFVMELVRGEPITTYCDNAAMDVRARLELFQQVCHAVQHAHQKGIIHRDLKPSNILVGEIDGKPAPKIIDFGIAKATGGAGALTDKTLFTDFRQFIGTPEYMSPEQAGMGAVDIDTRSDIYSLGVLLYELLTGGPPFDAKKLRSAAWEEMRRIIREDEPPRPSTRLHTRQDTREVAARRHTEPARLVGLIRGDLDWIVMKCLEKDRSRRYATANALAMDIERHLRDEPVLAGPPGAMYRMRKFVQRRRGPVLTAAAGLALLVGATVLSTSLWLRAAAHAERARDAEARATHELWASYLSQSRARRRTPEMGRRFESLEIIRRAAAIRPNIEARNEAVAALALEDARVAATTPERPLPGPFAFGPAPEWVLVSGASGTTEVRRVSDDALLGVIPRRIPRGGWVNGASFSADGSRAAVRAADDAGRVTVGVWTIPAAERLLEVAAESDFALSPEGDLLAVVGGGRLRVLAVPSGQERWSREAPPDCFLSFRPGHDQLSIAPQLERGLMLLNARTGDPEADLTLPAGVGGMCWSPTGERLALGCADFAVRVSAEPDFTSWIELRGHQALPAELYFDPAGERVLSDSWDSTARIWDLLSERCVLTLPAGKAWPSRSRDTLLGYVQPRPRSHQFQSLELARPGVFRRAAAPGLGGGAVEQPFLAVHPTLPCVMTGFGGGTTLVFWTATLDRVLGLCDVEPTAGAAFSPAGDVLYTTGRRGLEARTVGVEDDTLRIGPPRVLEKGWGGEFDVSGPGPTAVGLPSLESRVAASLDRGAGGAAQTADLPVAARGVDVSPDGRFAAFWTWHDPDVAVWDLADGSRRTLGLELPGFATFSPDGERLVASMWGADRVFELPGWRPVRTIDIPDSVPFPARAAFTRDGATYARVIDAQRVRLFRTDSFDELCTLESPEPFAIHSVAFSPDGGVLLAATNRAHVAYVWSLPALRSELRALGLDWSDGPIPRAGEGAGQTITAVVQTVP